jgi:cytochrome P450
MASDEFLDKMLEDLLNNERDSVKTMQYMLRSYAAKHAYPDAAKSFIQQRINKDLTDEALDDMLSYLLATQDSPAKMMQNLLLKCIGNKSTEEEENTAKF